MGDYSRDTFDKLKHYVGVRLQQGVPLVDADWNEMEDIRKHELRDFLKNFVGNGVPDGNDGFRITAASPEAENDFIIKGGDGTPEGVGRCLVDGWDVMNESDINYTAQVGVPSLHTPAGADRTDIVYLDVWEREVEASEDATLVNPAMGIETCVRLKLEWVVRVQEDVPEETRFPTISIPEGHAFYPLAILQRAAGEATIPGESIIDLRLTGLSMGFQNDIKQIAADVYGPDYSLDHDSQPNLKVSLNESIRAVLRGDSPSTPVRRLTTDPAADRNPSALIDGRGDIWVFWDSYRSGNYDIYYKRYINGTWGDDTPLTMDTHANVYPSAVIVSQEDIWVFWISNRSGNGDIYYKRYSYMNSEWGDDTPLTTDIVLRGLSAVKDSQGDIWVFWDSNRSGNHDIYYKRYSYMSSEWGDDTPLTTDPESDLDPSAVIDSQGDIWVFWISDRSGFTHIYYNRYINETWGEDTQLTTTPTFKYSPSTVIDSQGDIWVFWISYRSGNTEIYYKRYMNESWGDETLWRTYPGIDWGLSVVADRKDDIWVFWYSARDENLDIWYQISTPNYWIIKEQHELDLSKVDRQQIATDVYGPDYSLDQDGKPNLNASIRSAINAILRGKYPMTPPKRLTTDSATERLPSAVIDSQGDMWVFWNRNYDIYYKR